MNRILNILVVLLPLTVLGDEPIRIHYNNIKPIIGSTVPVSGNFTGPVTDEDIEFFDLTEEKLIKGVAEYNKNEPGGTPVSVSITPKSVEGKKFAEFPNGGKPLEVTIIPIEAKVVDVDSGKNDQVAVYSFKLVNKNSNPTKFEIESSHTAEKKTEFTWSFADKDTFTKSLQVDFKYVAAKLSMSNINTWGEDKTFSEENVLSVSDKIGLELNGGNSSKVTMKAKKSMVLIKMTYLAFLRRHVLCNHPDRYKGHYFHFTPIHLIPGIQYYKNVTQLIRVEYSSDLKIARSSKTLGTN